MTKKLQQIDVINPKKMSGSKICTCNSLYLMALQVNVCVSSW